MRGLPWNVRCLLPSCISEKDVNTLACQSTCVDGDHSVLTVTAECWHHSGIFMSLLNHKYSNTHPFTVTSDFSRRYHQSSSDWSCASLHVPGRSQPLANRFRYILCIGYVKVLFADRPTDGRTPTQLFSLSIGHRYVSLNFNYVLVPSLNLIPRLRAAGSSNPFVFLSSALYGDATHSRRRWKLIRNVLLPRGRARRLLRRGWLSLADPRLSCSW